jgi:hypothetical protein
MEQSMATIKANGGAASVWEHPKGLRVVLCRNGKVLTGVGPGAYHHAQNAALVALVGKPLATQALALSQLGFAPAKGNASVRASTTVAAHWHRQAKHARAIRRASH